MDNHTININYIYFAYRNQIPQFCFAHSLFYTYLIIKNQVQFWILFLNLLFITGSYCLFRMYDHLDQQIIWAGIHYIVVYIILTNMNYHQFIFMMPLNNQIFQNSERFKWKEMSQHVLFQDNYTKNLCFNQIREGVILYEQGYEQQPTFIDRSAKQMFYFFMKLKFKCHIKTILRLKKTEVKKSMQSLNSIGIDIQNSVKQYSGSLSFNSKSQHISQQALKEITLQQMLDKIWFQKNKESYLFYVQQSKLQSNPNKCLYQK